MAKRFPVKPSHPERICWGCDRYCPVGAMMCGNGSVATPHPSELFGEDWQRWGAQDQPPVVSDAVSTLPGGPGMPDQAVRPS